MRSVLWNNHGCSMPIGETSLHILNMDSCPPPLIPAEAGIHSLVLSPKLTYLRKDRFHLGEQARPVLTNTRKLIMSYPIPHCFTQLDWVSTNLSLVFALPLIPAFPPFPRRRESISPCLRDVPCQIFGELTQKKINGFII